MRKELRYSHERIHQLHREAAAGGALASSPPSAAPAPLAAPETDTSRPHSFVSVASSSDAGAAGGGGGGGPVEHAETDDESEWPPGDADRWDGLPGMAVAGGGGDCTGSAFLFSLLNVMF